MIVTVDFFYPYKVDLSFILVVFAAFVFVLLVAVLLDIRDLVS